jgi:hypothetical protein
MYHVIIIIIINSSHFKNKININFFDPIIYIYKLKHKNSHPLFFLFFLVSIIIHSITTNVENKINDNYKM